MKILRKRTALANLQQRFVLTDAWGFPLPFYSLEVELRADISALSEAIKGLALRIAPPSKEYRILPKIDTTDLTPGPATYITGDTLERSRA